MVVSLYAALLAIFFICLSINVIRKRRKLKAVIGDAENAVLQRAIRAQANFAEYTPFFLILLSLTELNGISIFIIHALGLLYIIGRLIHAYGLLRAEQLKNNFRFQVHGMQCTFISFSTLAVILLIQVIQVCTS